MGMKIVKQNLLQFDSKSTNLHSQSLRRPTL